MIILQIATRIICTVMLIALIAGVVIADQARIHRLAHPVKATISTPAA